MVQKSKIFICGLGGPTLHHNLPSANPAACVEYEFGHSAPVFSDLLALLPESEIAGNEEHYHHNTNNVENIVHVSSSFRSDYQWLQSSRRRQ